jgi:glycerophosphoryl diester phosphodiesterase
MHDATVDRTTNGTGPINEYSLDELLELDAGYWWSDDANSYPYRDAGISAAALDDVFSTFPEYRMNIEIKGASPSIAEAFCAKIREFGMEEQVLVASFRQEALEAFRQECPEVATSAGRSEVTRFYILSRLFLESILSPDAHALQVPEYEGVLKVLSERFVDGAKNRNIDVHAWTINEVEDMERILELGVDGIITDYPDRLMALLDR